MKRAGVVLALLFACGGSSASSTSTSQQAAVTAFTVTPMNGKVALSWTAAPNAVSYQILRSSGGAALATIATVTTTSFVDVNVRNGTSYSYVVRAGNAAGLQGDTAAIAAEPFRELCVVDALRNQVVGVNAEQMNTTITKSFGSHTGLAPDGVAVDGAHGEIFTANHGFGTVTVHAENAQGNVGPLRSLKVPGAHDITYDPQDDTVVVVTDVDVETFDRTATSGPPARNLHPAQPIAPGAIALSGPLHGDRLFLVNRVDGTIQVFTRTTTGPATPAAVITPQGLVPSTVGALAYDPDTDELLVGGSSGGQPGVFAYPASAQGTVAATRMLLSTAAAANFGVPSGLAVDSATRTIDVITTSPQILFFSDQFTGTVEPAPTAMVTGAATRLVEGGNHLALDATNGILAVSSNAGILTFRAAASGNSAPLTSIDSSATGIIVPEAITTDGANGEVLVLNQGPTPGVTAFALGAIDTPARSLSIPLTIFGGGLAVDPAHGELMVADASTHVDIFARTASSGAAPLRSISGDQTGLVTAHAVAYDTANDAVVVANNADVRRFARAFTDGNEAPLTVLAGPHTGIIQVANVAVDTVNGELFVADVQSGILVFHLTDTGDAAPIRTLAAKDPFTGFGPEDVVVDPASDEIFIRAASAILAYPRTASGNAAPARQITNEFTGLLGPFQMAICN